MISYKIKYIFLHITYPRVENLIPHKSANVSNSFIHTNQKLETTKISISRKLDKYFGTKIRKEKKRGTNY